MFKKILIIGAHFDDTELAAAGSAYKWINEGKDVFKLTLTDNVTNFVQKDVSVDYKSSINASKMACQLLGVKQIDFEYVKCNHLQYSTEIMQKVEKIIFDLNIDTVLIHSPNDANQDHVAAFQICSTAARHCDNILIFNINGYITRVGFAPNYFVNISGEPFSLKKKALLFYGKEHNRFGSLFETCLERNKVWGYSIHKDEAEAFEILKITD